MQLPIEIESIKGFLDPAEGAALYGAAQAAAPLGPIVEIGTYCAKSTVYLGVAARLAGGSVYSVDHHRGSEENQPGWEYFDPDLWDEKAGSLDTLPFARATLRAAGLEETVTLVVGHSAQVGRTWGPDIAMLFIDGGHSRAAAMADYRIWAPRVRHGGTLAIHDVFPDPKDGGRPPFEIYQFALASGLFEETEAVKSLRILRRIG